MTQELTPAVLAGWRRHAETAVQVDPYGARGHEARRTITLIDSLIESRERLDDTNTAYIAMYKQFEAKHAWAHGLWLRLEKIRGVINNGDGAES